MTASQKKTDLYNRTVAISFGSEYRAKNIDIGASSGVISTKYTVDGLNDAPDETVTREVVTGYHDEERTRIDVVEKKVYVEDGELEDVPQDLWIQSGDKVGDGMYITIDPMNAKILGIDNLDVTSSENASKTLESVSKAIESVSKIRSNIGAQQNRLEHTFNNVKNTEENLQAAESRIRDTDMAQEMVKLATRNMLEQAGISMMSQANMSNQGVLAILQ